MMYIVALAASTSLGYLTILKLRRSHDWPGPLIWFLSTALGLGLCGTISFLAHLVAGWHSPWAAIGAVAAAIAMLIILSPRTSLAPINWRAHASSFILLGILAIAVVAEALYYPLGGWDAWSCWNLKAKFMYMAGESWRTIFDPLLWRSNTQYPLLLPSITVWFWDWVGSAQQWVPMMNSVLFTLITAGILIFTLQLSPHQPGPVKTPPSLLSRFLPMILTGAIFLVPFNVTMAASQYCDIVVGMFLIAAFSCLLLNEYILCGLFLGLLSFTKTEGLAAAVLLAALIAWKIPAHRRAFLTALCLGFIPTIIFQWTMAPHNEAFVNGLTSTDKPSNWARLQAILIYPFFELIHLKWNGIWICLAAAAAWAWRPAISGKEGLFALFLGIYMIILLTYYQINTFFEIRWWMDTTLSRVLFALLPSIALWVGVALRKRD